MEDRPDLPALESVRIGMGFPFIAVFGLLWTLFIIGSVAWAYLIVEDYLTGPDLARVCVLGGTIAVLGSWIFVRLITADYWWNTDDGGLTVRGLFRRRFVRWSDVESVTTRRSLSRATFFQLRTRNGTLVVPARAFDSSTKGDRLTASIWQHLRREGRAEGMELTETALSLWDRIPDAVPRKMEWVDPRPLRWQVTALIWGLFIAFGVIGLAVMLSNYAGAATMGIYILFFTGVARMAIREARLSARRISLQETHVEAETAGGAVILPLDEIAHADWAKMERMSLCLKGDRRGTELLVPCRRDDEVSSKLILAIIRRLRTTAHPRAVTIPWRLRAAEPRALTAAYPQTMVLRTAWWARLLGGIFIGMFFGCVTVLVVYYGRESFPTMPTAAIFGGLFVLGWVMFSGYSVRIDDDGVSKRLFGFARTLRWSDVGGCGLGTSKFASPSGRLLKDANGKPLMYLPSDIGTRRDREQFMTALDARLSQILPPEELDPPWKSRPWRRGNK